MEQIGRYFNVMAVPVGRLSQLGFKIIAICLVEREVRIRIRIHIE